MSEFNLSLFELESGKEYNFKDSNLIYKLDGDELYYRNTQTLGWHISENTLGHFSGKCFKEIKSKKKYVMYRYWYLLNDVLYYICTSNDWETTVESFSLKYENWVLLETEVIKEFEREIC